MSVQHSSFTVTLSIHSLLVAEALLQFAELPGRSAKALDDSCCRLQTEPDGSIWRFSCFKTGCAKQKTFRISNSEQITGSNGTREIHTWQSKIWNSGERSEGMRGIEWQSEIQHRQDDCQITGRQGAALSPRKSKETGGGGWEERELFLLLCPFCTLQQNEYVFKRVKKCTVRTLQGAEAMGPATGSGTLQGPEVPCDFSTKLMAPESKGRVFPLFGCCVWVTVQLCACFAWVWKWGYF